jgi:hypothetical protein
VASALQQLEFLLLRYVPDAVKGEFVNIGVILLDRSGKSGFAKAQFATDHKRVRCMDPAADLEMLDALKEFVGAQMNEPSGREFLFGKLADWSSNGIQMSEVKPCLAEDPAEELARMAKRYLEPKSIPREAGPRARRAIFEQMRSAFEQERVWAAMAKDIAAARFTRKGDPLKIDCGYRPNGVMRLFQAVALSGQERDAAKVLAFSYPELREGMQREIGAKAELTAVIEDDADAASDEVAFALSTLEKSEIRVARLAMMPEIAQRARVELRM